MIKKWIALGLSGMTLLGVASAEQTTTALAVDSRVSVVPFSPDNVVMIRGTTFVATQIKFNSDETILSVHCGDAAAWTSKVDNNLPYMLFIKPEAYDSHTNMTVITNKHTYYFELNSGAKDAAVESPHYAIKFIYPEEERLHQEKIAEEKEQQYHTELSSIKFPGNYNWDYSFHGDTRLLPLHVFDDGTFTFFHLQPHQPVPAIFVVNDVDGNESLVNSRREGDYLIVQRVAPQFTLRSGKKMLTSVFNDALIKKMTHKISK